MNIEQNQRINNIYSNSLYAIINNNVSTIEQFVELKLFTDVENLKLILEHIFLNSFQVIQGNNDASNTRTQVLGDLFSQIQDAEVREFAESCIDGLVEEDQEIILSFLEMLYNVQ